MDADRFAEDVVNYLWRETAKHDARRDVREGRRLPGVWWTVRDGDWAMRVRAWYDGRAETTEPRRTVQRDGTLAAVLLVASVMGG